jgi:histidyl-tRNA synthetase
VRGLDYYTRTAFEFYRPGAESQQDALGGGGRYDGLVELLGGRSTPGIGFALGLDRVVLALGSPTGATTASSTEPAARATAPVAVVVGADPADTATRLRIATDLRRAGIAARAELAPRKLARQLEAAARDGAHFALIVGDELAEGRIQVRDLPAGTQHDTAIEDLARELRRTTSSHRHG